MRNVIVTGSGQGIGYAIAQAFDKEGDRVFIFDMSKEVADKAAQSLNNGVAYQVDVTDEPTIEKSIKEITEQYGPIDVLVNNAGIQFISKVEDFPLEKWNQVIGVIQTGTFLMTKHVLPSMKQQKKVVSLQFHQHMVKWQTHSNQLMLLLNSLKLDLLKQ